MRSIKLLLEKPSFVWLLVSLAFLTLFWTEFGSRSSSPTETKVLQRLESFSESSFPPKIGLVREVEDLQGHLAYYSLMGRVYLLFKDNLFKLRFLNLCFVLLALLIFIQTAYEYVYFNRINPLWVSLALLVFCLNPYFWQICFELSPIPFLLFLLLTSVYYFSKDRLILMSMFLSVACLADGRALFLSIAFIISKILSTQSRVLRLERVIALSFPLFIGLLPYLAWRGFYPDSFEHQKFWAGPEGFFYGLALLALFTPYFSWVWGLKARYREQTIGAILAAILIPLYFIFPLHVEKLGFESALDMGMLFHWVEGLAGAYGPFVFLLPFIAGAFLFFQLLLMSVWERSRHLKFFILLFMASKFLYFSFTESDMLVVIPFVLLLSLSESLVSEQGKLA